MLKRVERDVSKLHKIFVVDLPVDRAVPVVPCVDFQVTGFTDQRIVEYRRGVLGVKRGVEPFFRGIENPINGKFEAGL